MNMVEWFEHWPVFDELAEHPLLWLIIDTVKLPDVARLIISDGYKELPFD